MAIEGELARAGIITTIDKTIITKDLEVAEDLVVDGDVVIGGTSTIDGDLNIGGSLTGVVEETYYLIIQVSDLSTVATDGYTVVPTGGGGYVSKWRSVTQADVGASGCNLELNVGGVALGTSYDITVGGAGGAGDVDASIDIPVSEADAAVSTGEEIHVDVEGGTTNAVAATVIIEITRT